MPALSVDITANTRQAQSQVEGLGRTFEEVGTEILTIVDAGRRAGKSSEDMARDISRAFGTPIDRARTAVRNLEDALDAAGREGGTSGEQIEDALEEVSRKANSTGDELKRKIKGGLDEAGSEAGQSGREAAASFSGGFDGVVDFVQETAANAFSGFGPIGAAAGIAVAAAIGIAMSGAEQAQERLNDARSAAIDLAEQLYENKGVLPLAEKASNLFEILGREAKTGTQLQGYIDQWADFGTVLEQLERAASLTGRPLEELTDALSGTDIEQTREILADVTEQLDGLAEFTPVWAPEYQALSTAKTELEGIITQFEIAEKLTTPEVMDAKRVDDLATAWANAGVQVEDYFTKGEDGLTTFDVGQYIADMETQVAQADEIKADLLLVPPSIQAEAERIWNEQGVAAADAYVDGYQSADGTTKAKLEGLAGAQGQAAGNRAAQGFVNAANAGVNTFRPPAFDVAIRPYFDQGAMDRTLAAIRDRANRGAVTVMVNTRAGNVLF